MAVYAECGICYSYTECRCAEHRGLITGTIEQCVLDTNAGKQQS